MTQALVPAPGRAGLISLPVIIGDAGEAASRRFVEFFAATIRNPNTRAAYMRGVANFFHYLDLIYGVRGVALQGIEPLHVAAWIETHPGSPPTVKQHLAAVRELFDWLVTGQVVPFNPATSVKGPRHVVHRGKTAVLTADELRALFGSFDATRLIDLRDRAFIAVMLYSFARVSAVCGMSVADYYHTGRRGTFRLHEKGGRFHEVPAHHKAEEYLDAWLAAAGLA